VFELMRPEIIRDTAEGVMQDKDFRDVFNVVRSYASVPMARLIDKFGGFTIGKLVYIIRCL